MRPWQHRAQLARRVRDLEAEVAGAYRARALHARRDLAGDDICEACGTAWPCATTRALDGEQGR